MILKRPRSWGLGNAKATLLRLMRMGPPSNLNRSRSVPAPNSLREANGNFGRGAFTCRSGDALAKGG